MPITHWPTLRSGVQLAVGAPSTDTAAVATSGPSTQGSGGNVPDATRLLTLKGGDGKATIEEALNKYSAEHMSYMYKITKVDVAVLPVTNYAATITVTSTGPSSSKVEWRGGFYRGYPNNDPPANLNDDAAIKAVTGIYQSGLDALKAEMEKGGR